MEYDTLFGHGDDVSALASNSFAILSHEVQTSNNHILLSDPHGRHSHTRSNAHAGHADLLVRPLELVKESANLSCASASQRMTECNRSVSSVSVMYSWEMERKG